MANTFDEIANIVVPALLLIIVLGFLWVKFIYPWVIPMLKEMWEWMKGKPQEKEMKKEIEYE